MSNICNDYFIFILYLEIYCPSEFIVYKENGNRRFGRIWSIISINGILRMKMQRIYTYNELPNHFHCNAQSTTSELQLWLVNQYLEEGSIIVDTYEVIRKINIIIVRNNSNITNSLYIKEILYKNNRH